MLNIDSDDILLEKVSELSDYKKRNEKFNSCLIEMMKSCLNIKNDTPSMK